MIRPEDTQVVVLMGGLGTRLKEYTVHCPKPLVEVQGKPFFYYQLSLMKKNGFRRFLFLIGYKADMIEEYFGDGSDFGVTISYCYDGEELLGTGGAVRRAYDKLEDDFILMYGDSFMDINFSELLLRYENGKKQGAKALMTLLKNQNRFDKSNVVMKDGKLVLYDKGNPAPEMEYIDYGICMYEKSVFSQYPEHTKFDVAKIQNELSLSGEIVPDVVTKRFYEIGSPESLQEFSEYVKHRFIESHPAVFLDRDGVINEIVWNEDIEQLDSPLCVSQFRFLPNVLEGLKKIQEKGYYIFVITNQPAAAKGKTTYERLYDINTYMVTELARQGIHIEEVEMCTHRSEDGCACRKPKTGLIDLVVDKYQIDMEHSVMIGDSYTDILCGRSAGTRTALIGGLKCDVCSKLEYNKPDFIIGDLYSFSQSI